jgi:probable addiction module antidote protein
MSEQQLYDYDPAASVDGPPAMAIFMADALETGDAAYTAKAMGVVARVKGMAEISAQTGLSREHPYRSFAKKVSPRLKQ